MHTASRPLALVLVLSLLGGAARGQEPAGPPPPAPPAAVPGPPPTPRITLPAFSVPAADRLPPCLQADGIYIFDGNGDDLVKVLELSPSTGWVRAMTRAGESWINIANITTINRATPDAIAGSSMREKADFIRNAAVEIDAAIGKFAAEGNLDGNASFKWTDVRKYLKPAGTTYNSGGKDVTGRPYVFDKIKDGVKINPETAKELSPAVTDPDDFWGKFKP